MSIVVTQKIAKHLRFTTTWVYGTGNAITLPKAEYGAYVPGVNQNNINYYFVNAFGEKNGFRMEPYHRMDMAFQFKKELKNSVRTIELSVYNLYNRKNPYFYFIGADEQGNAKLKKINLFPILPSISWNYKF